MGQANVIIGRGSARGGGFTRLRPSLLPCESLRGLALALAMHFLGMLPREQGTLTPPCPQRPPHPPGACPCDHLVFLASMPLGSTDAAYAQSQALGGIQPSACLCVLANPFYPQNTPKGLSGEEGVQGWHGRGGG